MQCTKSLMRLLPQERCSRYTFPYLFCYVQLKTLEISYKPKARKKRSGEKSVE